MTGELGSESLSKIDDNVVEVWHHGVLQSFDLVDYGLDHIGMVVPAAHRSNPSERVQVPLPLLIKQVLLLPFHHVQGIFVEVEEGRIQILQESAEAEGKKEAESRDSLLNNIH